MDLVKDAAGSIDLGSASSSLAVVGKSSSDWSGLADAVPELNAQQRGM